MLEPVCLVLCLSMVFGSWFSCLEFRFCDGVPSECAVSSLLGRALFCPLFVVFCARSSLHAACVFHWLRAFMLIMSCVNMQANEFGR